MTVNIGKHTMVFNKKPYVMVSGRLLLAHEANPDSLSIRTEFVLADENYVVFRAEVTTKQGTFTGTAASYLKTGSPQDRKTPFEIAETSAIGRALGAAGFGADEGIASAEEMGRVYSEQPQTAVQRTNVERYTEPVRNLRDLQPTHDADDGELFDAPPTVAQNANAATEKQINAMYAVAHALNMKPQDLEDWVDQLYACHPRQLSKKGASEVIDALKKSQALAV